MRMKRSDIVRRARALVGIRFRPQGRDPAVGLDCVGVILCTFAIPSREVRSDYRLSGHGRSEVEQGLLRRFRRVGRWQRRPGDVLLFQVREDQVHLCIECGGSFVHADARLKRIVETPGTPEWPIRGVFRLRARQEKRN